MGVHLNFGVYLLTVIYRDKEIQNLKLIIFLLHTLSNSFGFVCTDVVLSLY